MCRGSQSHRYNHFQTDYFRAFAYYPDDACSKMVFTRESDQESIGCRKVHRSAITHCRSIAGSDHFFHQDQDIFAVFIPVRDLIHDLANEKYSQSPDAPVFECAVQVRFRYC
jgi:hypothetical protein